MLTIAKIDGFNKVREASQRLAQEKGCVRYCAVRANDDGTGLCFGYGRLEWAQALAPTDRHSLCNALYYEVYDECGELERVVYRAAGRLYALGGFELPLFPPCILPGLPPSRKDVTSDHTVSPAYPTPVTAVAENNAPLWWEVERAEKAEQREALIALRRQVRALVNYD